MSLLEQLNTIQIMDLELDALELEETSIPVDLANARQEKTRLEGELAQTKDNHAKLRGKVNEAELELRDLSDKRDRAKNDQKNAGSAKEQTQFENLIQQLAGRIEELENDSLPLIEKLEGLEESVKTLSNNLAELLPKLEDLESIDDARIQELRNQHASKREARSTLAAQFDPKMMREYDLVRKARKGTGLVTTKAGGRCAGCNVQLPMNVQQRVAAKTVGVKCPSCGRFLWTGQP